MPPTPSVAARLAALEDAVALAQARRLALLIAVHNWLTAGPDGAGPDAYTIFKSYLEQRLAEEGP